MSILIKDNQTGNIREYGTNGHDALHISPDGSCLRYENMQNGDGSLGGGYSFVMEDGKIPKESETADAIHGMCYFNVGGFRTEPEYIKVATLKLDKEELNKMVKAAKIRCKDCKHQKKWWREDKRMKDKGYWIYGCNLIDDSFVGTPVWGENNQFCSSAEPKGGAE